MEKTLRKPKTTRGQSIIEAIGDGLLDADLQLVARAAYLRAKAIGAVPAKKVALSKTRPESEGAASALVPSGYFQGLPLITRPIESWDGGDHRGTFSALGRRYRRENFVGKCFVIRPGTFSKFPHYDNWVVQIVGAGDQAIKVKYPSAAAENRSAVHQDTGYISHENCSYLYGE